MGARAVSPGGALLRKSRVFAMPKPLSEPKVTNLAEHKSPTMTKQHPLHQTLTSPLASREKGDWGLKRPFPLKTTLNTSTPMIRIKELDTVENVTDFASAADHSLSLEKFQEMRISMVLPRERGERGLSSRSDMWPKSVFEEENDTSTVRGEGGERRWKFQGPWLARMTDGEFAQYLDKKVRPKRAQFRALLKQKLAEDITDRQAKNAKEAGEPAPAKFQPKDISPQEFTEFLRSLRNDRATLYALVSNFLDLAPLGRPVGIVQSLQSMATYRNIASENPFAKSGPPNSHPSAGISYLRTDAYLENHPVYGPQGRKTPVLARVLYPRQGGASAKFGVGGFVANSPPGDNAFNVRMHGRGRTSKPAVLAGVMQLDVDTVGGAKAYVEVSNATVDPSGKVMLQLKESSSEAQVVAKEGKGAAQIYHDKATEKYVAPLLDGSNQDDGNRASRMNRVITEMLEDEMQQGAGGAKQVSSSEAYGLGSVKKE